MLRQWAQQLRGVFDVFEHFHHDDAAVTIFVVRECERPFLRTFGDGYMTERKPKEKKRKLRQAGMATGKKAMKQVNGADKRRMKLQYKSDCKSNSSRRLPARFMRR
ncbi:hypothetical protein AAVH_17017 [Aphelenchoides avenae]|nr:hypothetical protein AAVH_17017 [Aphelenchus avenae]